MANQTITTTKLNLRANQRGIAFLRKLRGLLFSVLVPPQIASGNALVTKNAKPIKSHNESL